jgi:hypothetical protein
MRPKDIETIDELLEKNYTIYADDGVSYFFKDVREFKNR